MFSEIHNFVKQNTIGSGCFSLTTLGVAKIAPIFSLFLNVLPTVLIVLQYMFGVIGATVGLITIYTFFEKKGLLPRWMVLPDKKDKDKNG